MRPNVSRLRMMTVKASELAKAVARAEQSHGSDWQAKCIEIALLPNVNRRWKAINRGIRHNMELTRVDGLPMTANSQETNLSIARADRWYEYAGYALSFWNSQAQQGCGHGYRHSPGTTWDGIRRETVYGFLRDLLACHEAASAGQQPADRIIYALRDYRIDFQNDVSRG